jgi:hypothetical protein
VNYHTPSKKSTTYASPVPYRDAVHILGSEEALRKSAGRLSRISNWKKRGVPAGIVLPALLLRFFEAEKRNSQLAGLPPAELQAGRGRLDKLPQDSRERYEARLKEITARGQREANEFLELLEAEHRTVRSKRKDKRK